LFSFHDLSSHILLVANARLLSKSLEATGWYTCVSDIHRPAPNTVAGHAVEMAQAIKETVTSAAGALAGGEKASASSDPHPKADNNTPPAAPSSSWETSAAFVAGLPVVSFRLTDEFQREFPHVKQETISLLLRARQWIIPNYALPPTEDATDILRVVIRQHMSLDLLERLVADIVQVTEQLMAGGDEVDLSILKKQRRAPDATKKKGEGEKKDGEKGEEKTVGGTWEKNLKRMGDGIHRSVC
jgi:glutamate decarboxylase